MMKLFRKKQVPAAWHVWAFAGAVLLMKAGWVFLMPMRGIASTTWLIDDSFIEMKVAQNLGLGHGFSLDGINPTTGAPFFWIYLSSINHMLFAKDLAIRMTLMETAFLGALATVVVFHLALKLTQSRPVAWTAFILSTFTMNAFLNALNGMDTALFTLLVMASIAAYFGVGRPKNWSTLSWGCVTGALIGLTTLTRGDGLFVLGALVVVKAYEWWTAPKHERINHWNALVGMTVVSCLFFAGFMAWQLAQTGSPFPGNQVGRRELSLDFHGFSFDHFVLVDYIKIVVWNVFQLDEILTFASGSFLLLFVAFVSGTLQKKLRVLGLISILYLGVFFALLVGYQWYFANLHGLRYINPATHILFIFLALLFWQLPVEKWKTATAVFLTTCVIVLSGYRHYQMTSRLPWAPYMSYVGTPDKEKNDYYWGTLDWMRDNLPEGTIVGVRDYGRASLFTNVRVQDLAGNIDPPVAQALNDGTLDEYLKQKKVEYLLIPTLEQRKDKLYQYLHGQMKLQLVKGAPQAPTQNLYKIIW